MASRSVRCGFLDPRQRAVDVTLPADVRRVAARSGFGVVMLGRVEVELNDSAAAVLPEAFATAGAEPEDRLTLRTGLGVDVGRIGGRSGRGLCFGVHVGERRLLGTVPPGITVAALAGWLADLHVTSAAGTLHVRPRHAAWATGRAPHVVLVLVLRSGARLLADVRPAYRPARGTAGLAVAGGLLGRVTPPDRLPYLTLDAPGHVVHLLPSGPDGLDEVAAVGAGLTVEPVPA